MTTRPGTTGPSIQEILVALLVAVPPLAYGGVTTAGSTGIWIVSLLLLVLWGVSMARRGQWRIVRTPLAAPGGVFVALASLSTLWSVYPRATKIELYSLWSYVAIYAVALHTFRDRHRLLRFSRTVVLFGSLFALTGLLLPDTTLEKIPYYAALAESHVVRVEGLRFTFVNPNHFAGYLEMVFGLCLGLALAERGGRRILYLLMGTCLAVAIVLSLSRGGMIGLLAGVFFFGTFHGLGQSERKPLGWLVGLLAFVVLIVAGQLSAPNVVSSLQTLTASSSVAEWRWLFWRDSLDAMADRPWLGSGLGTYVYALPPHQSVETADLLIDHPHNQYLERTVELGLLGGMAIFLWIAIFFTAGLKKLLVRQDLRVRALGLGAFTGCFSLLVHDLVDFQLSIPSNAILFCLCTAVAMLCATTPRAETSPGGLEWPLSGRQQKLAVFLIPTLGAATLILLGSPFLGSLYFQKATSHRHSENADAALSAVQKAIGWESDNADYYAMAGDLEWERAAAALDEAERERILQRALSLYRRATAACPVSSYAQGRQAQALLHLGQVDRARESFERATALAPARFEPHYHLAWFYLRHGAPEDSLRELRLAISLNPDYLVPSLSQLRRMGFKYPELRAVVPETAPSIATFSEFLMAQGEIEAGLLEQVRAVSIEPTLARALAHLETSRRHEPLPDTLKLYRSYVRQFPRSGTLRNTGAEILEDAGRPEEAIQELEILPLELVEELVALYMKIGRVEKAVSLVREEVAQRPDQVEAYLRLATLLRTEERCDEALQALREGEGRFPDEPRIPFEKVACLRELERPEEILAALKQSVRLEPTHVQYRYELGKAYESIGVYLEAEAQWKKALEMAPGHDPSRRALESLYGELGLLSEPLP